MAEQHLDTGWLQSPKVMFLQCINAEDGVGVPVKASYRGGTDGWGGSLSALILGLRANSVSEMAVFEETEERGLISV